MVCIYCGSKTQVTNSRSQKRTNAIWRRRVCLSCEATLTTNETTDLSLAIMVTDKTAQQPFSRDKLFISIYECCRHRKSAQNDATHLTDTVIKQLLPQIHSASLDKQAIYETTLQALTRFNKPAGVQYEAYYSNS